MASETERKYPRRPRFEDEEPIVQLGGDEPRPYNRAEDTDPYEKFIAHTKWVKQQDGDVEINHELRSKAQAAHYLEQHATLKRCARDATLAGMFLGVFFTCIGIFIFLSYKGISCAPIVIP